mgnify:CR=1 FL=1
MDFLKWYKHKIEANTIDPPEQIWENIQDELDVNDSWNHINHHLKQNSFQNRIKYLSLAASILALITFGTYWLLNSDSGEFKSEQLTEYSTSVNKASNKKTDLRSAEKFIEINAEELIQDRTSLGKNRELSKIKSRYDDLTLNRTAKSLAESKNRKPLYISYSKLNEIGIHLNDTTHKNLRIANFYKPNTDSNAQKSEKTRFTKLYIGSTGQLANTWLLNEKTYQGLEKTSLTASNASFGYNFGIYAGTNITKNIDLQVDFNILAKNNQNYNEYLDGKYIEDNLTLNYSQLALSGRLYFFSDKLMRGEHGFNLGGYIGYLHSAYQTLDNRVIDKYSDYNKFDFGIILSYEYVIPISDNLGFGTGVKANYGIKNIYSGNTEIPSYLNETSTASINFSFSLKYRIK